MARLEIKGGINSKRVNHDGKEHRHADNIPAVSIMPVGKPIIAGAPTRKVEAPEVEDND